MCLVKGGGRVTSFIVDVREWMLKCNLARLCDKAEVNKEYIGCQKNDPFSPSLYLPFSFIVTVTL